jgi:hypothetical protein
MIKSAINIKMKPGETYASISGTPTLSEINLANLDAETRLQRDNNFFAHVTEYQDREGIRDGQHCITVNELRGTNSILAAFTNDRRIHLLLNGAPGYDSYPAFSPVKQVGDGIVKTARIAISEPYDAFPNNDGPGSQSVCFALIGPGDDGDAHIVVARLTRGPEIPYGQRIGWDELQQAVPLAFIAQREYDRSITVFNVTCSPLSPEFPDSRPIVNIGHLTKENTELFIATEVPRLIAAMPLTEN